MKPNTFYRGVSSKLRQSEDGSHFVPAFSVAYARTRASCLTRAMLPARAACAQNFSPPVASLHFLTDVQKERERGPMLNSPLLTRA